MSASSPRKKVPYHHHHVLRHKSLSLPTTEPAILEQAVVDKLLIACLKIVCEEEACKQGIAQPVIESVALESFAAATEEFILKFLSKVRRSMLAARRTAPIAPDFETAIDVFDLPRPDDQLGLYETQPPEIPPLLPTPPPDDEFHKAVELPPALLGPELDVQGGLNRYSFCTAALPTLPSAHTYRDTAVYPFRELETRRIRELATQEGKLGEQALRKLAGAVKLDAAAAHAPDAPVPAKQRPAMRRRWKNGVTLSQEAVFETTLRDLLAAEPGGFELGPIVTCEKAYRMPDDVQVKRRHPADRLAGGRGTQTDAASRLDADTIQL